MQDGTSVSKQGFQGKNLFGHTHFQGINTGVQLGNFQQVNSLPRNASAQEFHGRQQQAGWLQEKASNQVGPSQSSVSLDPTEEKILFSSDDNSWDATVGGSSNLTGGYGNPLENSELFNAFPSIQNGTWSALMQSAVAEASSSDTGQQDEWSGLSFHKTEMSTGNQAAIVSDSPKKQKDWVVKSLPSASSLTSRPFPLFDDANMNPSGHSVPGSQQPRTKFSCEQSEKIQPNACHEYIEQSPKEPLKWLNHSVEQKSHVEGNHLVQLPMHLENASDGAWRGQIYEQLESSAHSRDMGINAQNMDGSWVHMQNLSSYKNDSQPCNRSNGWNTNELLSANGNAPLKMHENDNAMRHTQTNDLKKGTHMERDPNGGMWKAGQNHVATSFSKLSDGLEQVKSGTDSHNVNRESSYMSNSTAGPNLNSAKANQETQRQVQNNYHLEYGKHVVDSSVKYKGDDTVAKYQHQVNKKEISNENYNSNQSHHNATGGMRENSWLSPNDSRSFGSGNQKSVGQVGRKASGSRKFQYHPMGDLAVNVDPSDTRKHVIHSQSRQVIGGAKSLEQGYLGYSKFVGQIPNNFTHMEEGQVPKIQENVKGSAELPSRRMHQDSTVSSSIDRSTGFYAQNKSHHMLELLDKVDQSTENSSVTHFGSADRIPLSRMPEAEASDASVAHLQRDQSACSQGFGLQLAPPTQRLPVPNHAFSSQKSSQMVNDLNSRRVDSEVGEKSQTWLSPTSSVQPLPPREMSRREYWDNKSSIAASGEAGNETSQLNKPAALFTDTSSYQRDQLQHQQASGASGDIKTDQPVTFNGLPSHFRHTPDTHNGLVADQSPQTLLPGTTNISPPFNHSHPVDASQLMGTNSSYPRASGQHLPVLESLPVSQPSATSGMSRQGAFSTMSNNVWTSVSAPQYVGRPAQSINLSNRIMERTSWLQKQDDQFMRKVGNEPEFGTRSINSQRFAYGEEQTGKERPLQQVPCEKVHLDPETSDASQGQESSGKHLPDANSIASDSLAVHPHHQVLDRRIYGKDPVLVPQTEHVSLQNQIISNRDFESFGHSLKQAHATHQNYSLLQQVQDMKGAETDPDTRAGKRFKGSDSGLDTQQIATKAGQQLFDGNNTIVRDVADNEVNAAGLHKSFLSRDGRMVRLSSEAREDQNTNSSQLVPGDLPSQVMSTFGRKDSQDCSSQLNMTSARSENPQISPRMAPSWFEQYGTFKNGQMLPTYNSRRTAESNFQPLFSVKSSESLHSHTSIDRVNVADAGQVGNVCQSTDTTLVANEHISPQSLPSEVTDQSLSVIRPKKRKNEKMDLLPWHKEVMHGSQRLLNISMAEQDWTQAANRLVEKVEDEVEMVEDGHPVLRPRRRLILTTQLMQQLLRPPPVILSADATSYYETVTYFIAKLVLGDACSLISSTESDSCLPADNGEWTSGKLKTSERVGDQYFSKVVEDFIGRARRLESDLSRLDKRSSMLDIRLESQELERFSMINRFAKFHGSRGAAAADGGETSLSSFTGAVGTTTKQKTFPQRYVTAFPMPRNLPQGVQCLSL